MKPTNPRAVPCPTCGFGAGSWCHTTTGRYRKMSKSHPARIEAAKKQAMNTNPTTEVK